MALNNGGAFGGDIVAEVGTVNLQNIADVEIDPSTEQKQDDAITKLGTIDTDTGNIAGGVGATADALVAAGAVGSLSAKLRRVTTDLNTIDADTGVIAGDTTSLDTKTPALGTAAMVASAPATIATDDTMITALDAAVDLTNDRIGATGDAAVAAGASGTVSAKMRRLTTDTDAIVATNIERYLEVDEVRGSDIGNWVAGTDVANIESTPQHIPHEDKTASIEMDKTGGTVTVALMSKTIVIDASAYEGPTILEWAVKHGNYTNVAKIVLRIGTDSSNYHEYSIDPVDFSLGVWSRIASPLSQAASQTGTGLNMSNIDYLALGVEMDAAANTIADVQFDEVRFLSAPESTAAPVADVTSIDIGATVRVTKVGTSSGSNWPKDAGAVTNGTPRMTLASDDPAVALLDAAIGAEGAALGSGVLLQGDDGTDRTNVLVDTDGHVQVDVVTGGGVAGTEFAEDTQHASGAEGPIALAVRKDARGSLAGTDGDYSIAQLTANGDQRVRDDDANTVLIAVKNAVEIMDDWDETNRAKVNLIAGQAGVAAGSGAVDALTPRVTIATDDVNLAAILAAVAVLKGTGAPTIDSHVFDDIAAAADTDNQVIAATPGADKQIWVMQWYGSADTGNGSVQWLDESDATLSGVMEVAQRGFFGARADSFTNPVMKLATNKALHMKTVTCGFKGTISYIIVSV